jgi:hypothetical protein
MMEESLSIGFLDLGQLKQLKETAILWGVRLACW